MTLCSTGNRTKNEKPNHSLTFRLSWIQMSFTKAPAWIMPALSSVFEAALYNNKLQHKENSSCLNYKSFHKSSPENRRFHMKIVCEQILSGSKLLSVQSRTHKCWSGQFRTVLKHRDISQFICNVKFKIYSINLRIKLNFHGTLMLH